MIKHRFILRSWKEAEVFAAVPTEHEVLVWRRWERPILVNQLLAGAREHVARIEAMTDETIGFRELLLRRYGDQMSDLEAEAERQRLDQEAKIVELERRVRAGNARGAEYQIAKVRREHEEAKEEWRAKVDKANAAIEVEVDKVVARMTPVWAQVKVALAEHLAEVRGVVAEAEQLATDGRTDAANYHRLVAALAASSLVCATTVKEVSGDDHVSFAPTFEVLAPEWIAALKIESQRPDPTDVLTCPEGVPFPYYTVEVPFPPQVTRLNAPAGDPERVVVEVVEGSAWFEAGTVIVNDKSDVGDAIAWRTETVRMAAELVTQMLTERIRNPRAETRVLVDEVNSAKAQEVRREEAAPGAEPRLRSIKFDVAPPRYLREAAERIIASKVKAHWVMGHWRNQPYGAGRQLRRETWIAPHVRGLGEAGATMAKVAAPRRTA